VTDSRAAGGEAERLKDAGSRRPEVLAALLEAQRARLQRMVELRMDPRLRARVGASDVLQEAFLEIGARLEDWLADPSMPFAAWVRFLTAQRLAQAHRFHVGAQRRAAGRERHGGGGPAASSATMAEWLADGGTTPTQGVVRNELRAQLEQALDLLEPMDREVLALRHFEEFTNAEVASALGIEVQAASKRYVRALERLRAVLDVAGGAGGGAFGLASGGGAPPAPPA
jgi:RNA polymerase sigma-70 factor (ECF subfamily)